MPQRNESFLDADFAGLTAEDAEGGEVQRVEFVKKWLDFRGRNGILDILSSFVRGYGGLVA